jgi:hypothetical protein
MGANQSQAVDSSANDDVDRACIADGAWNASAPVGSTLTDDVSPTSRAWGKPRQGIPLSRRTVATGVVGALFVLGGSLIQPGRSAGQQPPEGADAAAKGAPADRQASAEPLSVKYRFIEKYALDTDPARHDSQYMVASKDTIRTQTEKPQGAPDRTEHIYQTIYTEAPLQVNKLGEVIEAMRRYDSFRLVKGSSQLPSYNPPILEGLTISWKLAPGKTPQVLSLNDNRSLRQLEYEATVDQLFLPRLTAILPRTPIRVGDTWRILRQAGQTLVGRLPEAGEYALDGTLTEVRRAASGTTLTAVFELAGQIELEEGPGEVKAQIHFVFDLPVVAPPSTEPGAAPKPAAAATADTAANRKQEVVEARGRISRVLMGRSLVSSIPGEDRLKRFMSRELNLERRPLPTTSATPGGRGTPLERPSAPTIADEAHAWLVYDDPQGRFHFSHPQELRLDPGQLMDPNSVGLVDRQPMGDTVLFIQYQPKSSDPARDRQLRDPEYHRRNFQSTWEKRRSQIVPGSSGWLPEAEWKADKRRVYRIEAALKQTDTDAGAAPRVYCDYYLVLFATNQSIAVTAMTVQDPHVNFRKQVEDVIRNFEFGPSKGRAPIAAPTASPARPAPANAPQ